MRDKLRECLPNCKKKKKERKNNGTLVLLLMGFLHNVPYTGKMVVARPSEQRPVLSYLQKRSVKRRGNPRRYDVRNILRKITDIFFFVHGTRRLL